MEREPAAVPGRATIRTIMGTMALATAVVVVDALTKRQVTATLGPAEDRHSWWVFGEHVGLEYVRNSGAAFGLLRGNAELLGAASLAIAVGFAGLILWELGPGKWTTLAGGLVAGGAIGNLIERIANGYVTDFFAVGPWPRFNVADIAITVGVSIFIFALVTRRDTASTANAHTPVEGGSAHRDRST